MTAAWMVYATCVGALLTVAAIIVERPLQQRNRSARVAWIAALAVALLWPLAITLRAEAKPSAVPNPVPVLSGPATSTVDAQPVAEQGVMAVRLPRVLPASPSLDGVTERIAVVGPLLMLILLLIEGIRVSRAGRHWVRRTIDNVPVLVSPAFGPAIVGVLRPQIVIPSWVLELPAAERALMLTHEAEHLAARDSWWLALAFAGIIVAPWNVSLWWLVRRVRLSIEVECDRRVLRRGHDLAGYASLLLEAGRRANGGSMLVAGFAERRSMLRARIDQMTDGARMTAGRQALRFTLAAALLVAACGVRPARGTQAASPEHSLRVLVGDSIFRADEMRAPTRAAHDLPQSFTVVATMPASIGAEAGRCPRALTDERDGTELLVEMSRFPIRLDASRPDSGTQADGVGYYSVRPVGRYGVANGEWLRVGCPRVPARRSLIGTVAAGAISSRPLDAVLKDSLGITADTLTRRDNRLDIGVVQDSAATSRQRALAIAALAWRQLGGPASALDTITVRVQPRSDFTPGSPVTSVNWIRWVFYPKQGELVNR